MEYVLFFLLFMVIIVAFNPISWIIVAIVTILKNHNKKKSAQQSQKVTAQTKATDSIKKWNWLLYIGSLLVVLAMFYYVDYVNDSFVAPFTIISTLIIYITGLIIYNKIDYLRPVGRAFTYSAICMIPIWAISLETIGFHSTLVPLFVTIPLSIAIFIATILTKNKSLAYLTYLSIVPIILAIYPAIDPSAISNAYYYFIYLSIIIAALPPFFLNLIDSKQLPDVLRDATKEFGKKLMPIAYISSLTLFFVPRIAIDAPFLRLLCALFFLLYTVVSWLYHKERKYILTLRLAIQGVILGLVFDLLGVSLIDDGIRAHIIDNTTATICAIIWLLSFMIQIIFSLFSSKNTAKQTSQERATSIFSLLCIFITPSLCQNFSTSSLAIVWLSICLIIAVLGIIHAIHYKNTSWTIATSASIMIVPTIIGHFIANPQWKSNEYFVAYSIIAAGFLVGTYFLRRFQSKESNLVGSISVLSTCCALLITAANINITYVGLFITACILFIHAIVTKVDSFYETAIYTFGFCLMSITDTAMGSSHSVWHSDNYQYALKSAIYAHIIIASLAGAHALISYLNKKKSNIRLIIAYVLFSIIMTESCLINSAGANILIYACLFLAEQAGVLIYGVSKKINWLICFSAIEIIIIASKLTEGISFLWLGIIGIGLITVVIWQLKKANNKIQNNKNIDKIIKRN